MEEFDDTRVKDVPFSHYRRVASAVLVSAIADAGQGNPDAVEWLHSPDAHRWAELLELPFWPPTAESIRRASRRRSVRNWAADE